METWKVIYNRYEAEKEKLIESIKLVSDNCTVCKQYKIPSPRPVVGFSLANEFNEVVAMDLKFHDGSIILQRFVMADHLKLKISFSTILEYCFDD